MSTNKRITSRSFWRDVLLVSLALAYIIPLVFGSSLITQITSITGLVVVGLLAIIFARHSKFTSVVTICVLFIWLVGVFTGGYQPASLDVPIPSGDPILSGPWFPVVWFSAQVRAGTIFSVIDSLGLWLVVGTVLAWLSEAIWKRLLDNQHISRHS